VKCRCGQPVEVKWTVNGSKTERQEHFLCGSCMSTIWSQVNQNYSGSAAQQQSTFEEYR
jgi:hypothetical protein